MTNHIHLVAVPSTVDGLQRALKPLHMCYAQSINRAQGWEGHFWQERFFSSPMDEAYLWAAVRYVERNPVRVGIEHRAENYRWSSAAAHCGNRSDILLNIESVWSKQLTAMDDWSAWLSEGDVPGEVQMLRAGCPAVTRVLFIGWGEIVGCNKINRFNQTFLLSSFTHMLIWESVC